MPPVGGRPKPPGARLKVKKNSPKPVRSEAATRPVTPKQRKAIERGVRQAEQRQINKVVNRAVLKAEADEVEQKLNKAPERKVFGKVKVRVKGNKLELEQPTYFGLGSRREEVRVAPNQKVQYPKRTGIPFTGKYAGTGVAAPAVKVLQVAGTPGRAIGKEAEKAAKKLGAPKAVQTGARLVGEFALDPLTWTSLGTAPVAKKAAEKAGQAAYKQAVKQGVNHTKATRIADKAAKKAAQAAPQNKGLVVKFAGKSTSGRTTAAIMRGTGLSKGATKIRESKLVQGVGRELRPDFRPKGISDAEFQAIRGASRKARSQQSRGRVEAISKAQAIKKDLSVDDYAKVVNAIERGTVYDLPEKLRAPAREVELAFRRARKAEVKAGIKTGNRRQYFTHALEETAEQGGKKGQSSGKRVIRPEYAKSRRHEGTIEQIAKRGGPQFSTDVPVVVAQRLSKSATDVAQANFNRALMNAGRKVKHGEELTIDPSIEGLFRIQGSDLVKVPAKEIPKALNGKTDNLRVLNERVVEEAYKSIVPGASRHTVGKGYDKLQGSFKFIATVPNPGFHMRNLYGDTFNAYLGQNTAKLAVNVGRSARTLRQLGKQEEATRTLGKTVKPTEKGITVKGKYGGKEFISYDRLAKEAVENGAIRSGFVSRELPELLRDTSKAASKSKERLGRTKRLVQNREDLLRLATYIGARKGGKTASEAADYAAKHHFDYADLTDFERTVLRRMLPFYTFSSRNIPLQAKTLVTKPGKYANIEKVRAELADAVGLPEDYQEKIPEYQARGIPFPVEIDGKVVLASPALPLSDLNQLAIPVINPGEHGFIGEQWNKFASMLNPVIKSPVELAANYNFFFRSDIERDESPLVAAPSYVATWSPAMRKKFGVVPDYIDKRTGKKGWGWPGKVDYVAKIVPGIPNFAQQLITPLANRRGQDTEAKVALWAAGVKADPYDPVSAKIPKLYDEKAKLEKRRAALRQRGIGSAKGGRKETPEYKRLSKRITDIDYEIGRLSKKRGDKIPLGKNKKVLSPAEQARQKLYGSGGGAEAKKAYDLLYGQAGGSAAKQAHKTLYGG